jgi:predicted enzyme related to lactoylglutathione lyase
MDLTFSHCFLPVLNQDEALAFYRDVVGLEVRSDAPFQEFRWLTVGPKGQPEIEINLSDPIMGHSPEDAEMIRALVAKGAYGSLIFLTDDVDALFERIPASGAEVTQEPIDQPYGVRDCGFRDPSGNHVRFSQTLAA